MNAGLSVTVLERVPDPKFRDATYKYAPAGKREPAPVRSGPSVELPATVNCLLRGFDGHLARFNGLPETAISHSETFNALPVTVRGHFAMFNALPDVVISHPAMFKGLPVAEIGHPVTEIGHLVMFGALPVVVNG